MIACTGLVKIYRSSGVEVFALQGLDLAVSAGEMVAVMGSSGSGKSTLLNVLGGLDSPTAGTVRVNGWDLNRLTPRQRDRYRRTVTGFVWQNSALNLLPYLSARENVRLAASGRKAAPDADELLAAVGAAHLRHALPPQLSGGEQQRVAIAVALANQPALLLADEPTGALDTAARDQVMAALQGINRSLGTTVLLVTHDVELTRHVDRTVRIRDGKVAAETVRGAAETVVLDSAGRLPIPRPLLEQAGIGLRAEVALRGRELIVRAPAAPSNS